MTDYTSNPTHELTELIREERYARTLANIARRAENLWDDGYTFAPQGNTTHFQDFLITTPANALYRVTLSDTPQDEMFGDYCSCPAFEKYGECKHHLAIVWKLREETETAAFDAMMANAEGVYGCDPDIHW